MEFSTNKLRIALSLTLLVVVVTDPSAQAPNTRLLTRIDHLVYATPDLQPGCRCGVEAFSSGITRGLSLAAGAKIPSNLVILNLGGCTSVASRSINSNGS